MRYKTKRYLEDATQGLIDLFVYTVMISLIVGIPVMVALNAWGIHAPYLRVCGTLAVLHVIRVFVWTPQMGGQ